jgi:hypothetical protein
MSKEEAIKYLQQLYPNGGHCWLDEQRMEAIGIAIKTLQEEPVSEDLMDATNNYCVNVRKGYPRVKDETDRYICNAFEAGANWQKEQMMAKTIEGYVLANGMGEPILHLWDKGKHLVGKKVKVVVIKED